MYIHVKMKKMHTYADFCFTEASIQLSTFFCFGPAETRREVDNKSDTII